MKNKIYDLIIVGTGPAGLTAGIYAKNFGLESIILGEKFGGLINTAYKIENYPGIFGVPGKELVERFKNHQKYLKLLVKKERIKGITVNKIKKEKIFFVYTSRNIYRGRSIILAIGTEPRVLKIKNIEKFEDKGVYYYIDKSTFTFKNKIIAVIGGANSAAMTACMLSEKAKKVYIIYRRERLRADAIWVNKIKKLKNIEVVYKANVIELRGEKKINEAILDNGRKIKIDNLVIEAGTVPNSFLIKQLRVKTDKNGYIIVKKDQSTNIKGIFAAGDITNGSNGFRQIVTACAEGAIAALGVFNYLSRKK